MGLNKKQKEEYRKLKKKNKIREELDILEEIEKEREFAKNSGKELANSIKEIVEEFIDSPSLKNLIKYLDNAVKKNDTKD